MTNQRLLAGALLCALLLSTPSEAKERRGFLSEDAEAARALPVQVLVMQERLLPQYRYNYIDTSQASGNIAGNMFGAGGMSIGQAAGVGLAGGLIAAVIVNTAEKTTATQAVREPYEVISQAGCAVPLLDSHQAMVADALRHAEWPQAAPGSANGATAKGPRYELILSTSLTPDYAALMTSIDAVAYVADGDGKAARRPTWQDSLVVVSDGLWLPAKTPSDIEQMVATELGRYDASGANELVRKVNAAGANAPRADRKRAVLMTSRHARNMADARSENWSPDGTAMHRAMLWSENGCALLEKTMQDNLVQAGTMLQALLRHSLPTLGDEAPPARPVAANEASVESPTAEDVLAETTISVGVPDGSAGNEPSSTPTRVIEALPGSTYVSRLAGEDISLGYRYTVLDDD